MTGEWRSYVNRDLWPPEVVAEVEAAEERMWAAADKARRAVSRYDYAPQPMQPPKRRGSGGRK